MPTILLDATPAGTRIPPSGYRVAVPDPAVPAEPDDPAAALDRLAAAVRALNDAVVRVESDPDRLHRIAADVEDLTAALVTAEYAPRPLTFGAVRHDRHLVGGTAHPFAPQLHLRPAPEGGLRGSVTLGPAWEGGPGLVHGGIVALLFDHAMGEVVLAAGRGAMTVSLEVRYRRPTPLNVPVEVRCRLDAERGRKITLTAETLVDGRVTAEATGVFLVLTPENVAEIFREGPPA